MKSLRNTFDFIAEQIKVNIDLLMVSETKLDESLFKISGFSTTFRLNRSCNGGGIVLFIRKYVPPKLISSKNPPAKMADK